MSTETQGIEDAGRLTLAKALARTDASIGGIGMAVVRKQDPLTLTPSTGWGRWAIGFVAAFVLLVGVFFAAMFSGQRGGATLGDNLWLSIPIVSAGACAVLSLVTGLVAVIVRKERSVFVFGAMAFMALVAFFGIGEFAFPH